MKFKKAEVADILWFVMLATLFVVLMRLQLEFSSTATIESYAKNIINEESTRFVQSISGFSQTEEYCNMFNSKGDLREYGGSRNIANSLNDDDATAYGIVNRAKKDMIENIQRKFSENNTLNTRVMPLTSDDIKVDFTEPTGKSTMVTVTVDYTIGAINYAAKDGGFLEERGMIVDKKEVVTRAVENPLRFK